MMKETTHYHIKLQVGNEKKLVHLMFLKQEYGVSVQDVWMAWFDHYNSRCHGDTAKEAVENLVNTYVEHKEFRELFQKCIDKSIASFRTPVIG